MWRNEDEDRVNRRRSSAIQIALGASVGHGQRYWAERGTPCLGIDEIRESKLGLGATTNAAEYQHVRRLADGPHSSTLTDEAYDDAKNWISFER